MPKKSILMPLAMAVVDVQKAPAPETSHGHGEFWYLQSRVTCGALHGTEGLVAPGGLTGSCPGSLGNLLPQGPASTYNVA